MNRIKTRKTLLAGIGIATIAGLGILITQAKPTEPVCQLKRGSHVFVTPINTNPQKPEASTSSAGNILTGAATQNITIEYCALPGTKVLGVLVTGTNIGFNQAEAVMVSKQLQRLDGTIRVIQIF
ncbi:hypothetical protein ACQ4M3_37255 [Leptolyngbya sp. AN03gr2]|uniref:hypothetical protein n=1 Tax=unclassified Leptolyngbya TaxID=2650499 RepID=UPI003D31F251